MQGFVWVIFFTKAIKAFCYPALLWMDGFFFSALKDSENQRSFRYCLLKLYMFGDAPLLMTGIYNNYSGYYKVRQRLYDNRRFVKLTYLVKV